MSRLDDSARKYGLDLLNTWTKYPSNILLIPEDKNIQLVDQLSDNWIKIVYLDGDFFLAKNDEFIHAKADRILTDKDIIPVYRSCNKFFQEYRYNPVDLRLITLYGEIPETGQERIYRIFGASTILLKLLNSKFETNQFDKVNEITSLWSADTIINFCGKFSIPCAWERTN